MLVIFCFEVYITETCNKNIKVHNIIIIVLVCSYGELAIIEKLSWGVDYGSKIAI